MSSTSNKKTMSRNWSKKSQISLFNQNGKELKLQRQNTMSTNDLQTEQLFPQRWPLSNPNGKSIMNKLKLKHHRTLTAKQATKITSEPSPWNGQ